MSEKRFTDVAETPREELECKKKYLYEYGMFWECNDGSKCQILEDDVVRLLNEQQSTIEYLTVEKFKENKRFTKLLSEQQSTINILLEELVNAQQQGYVVGFLHKNEHCILIPKELDDE